MSGEHEAWQNVLITLRVIPGMEELTKEIAALVAADAHQIAALRAALVAVNERAAYWQARAEES